MTDYVESPLGRVVNVAWPGISDPGLLLKFAQSYWLWFTNGNGARRVQFEIYLDDWDAFASPPVVGDRARILDGATLLEDHPITSVSRSEILNQTSVNSQTVYLPGTWPVPNTKPTRFEIRRNGSGDLIFFSEMLASLYTYEYNYSEDDGNFFQWHRFDDAT